jgi:CDP-glycerol glycerophosphotransferase
VKVDELATGLLDLDGLAAHHRDRYDSFRAKFAPWDDGKAAARVIDAFFD